MKNFFDYTLDELTDVYIKDYEQKKYRAVQTFKWLYEDKVEDVYHMTDIPFALRERLVKDFQIGTLKEEEMKISPDGTRKYLFTLADGSAVETVLMKYEFGNSVCVSTQVGCRMKCDFCASSKLSFGRNLTSGEIVEQIVYISRKIQDRISNVVFMGIGEPFDNYDNVMRAIKIINEPHGLNIGARHITVSTSGLVPQIVKFANEGLQCNLSISLHATNDKVRDKLMPVNKAYNIETLMQACRKYLEKTNRRITFEYALIAGVNDSTKDACALVDLLNGMLCHVNLIPVNAIEGGEYRRPNQNVMMAFRDALNNRGVTATIRRELGNEIDAACGQLRRRYYEE
ncbi:MAG: 23S rRNA (adenine(2503)-C(2))-methyltransferase RlmN [Clostridia bacterium]|nr:23S rRNA (adenine(2503)-C(2))-methyltransferase RlmN [Clostridia bacterium]